MPREFGFIPRKFRIVNPGMKSLLVILVLFLFVLPISFSGYSSNTSHSFANSRSNVVASSVKDPSQQVNVYLGYNSEPAPMGIADFGVSQNGAYQYSTNSFLGTMKINSLSTQDPAQDSTMGFQLNINLVFQTGASQKYVYWVQDVAELNTATNYISFVDNVWNASAAGATLVNSGISGSGIVARETRRVSFYYDAPSPGIPGNDVTYTLPLTLQFRMNSTQSSLGQPQVTFEYNDGFGWQTLRHGDFSIDQASIGRQRLSRERLQL